MRKFIAAIALTAACFYGNDSHSQVRFHIGGNSAMNTTFVLDKGLNSNPFYDPQRTYNWSPVGLVVGLDLSKTKGFQIEPMIVNTGQKFYIVDSDNNKIGERNIKLQYLNIPFLIKNSRGNKKVRFVTMIGGQLSMLREGLETYEYAAATIRLIKDGKPPLGAFQNPDGTYNVPAMPFTTIASTDMSLDSSVAAFRNKDIQLVLSMGLEFDISRYLYISTDIRGNYGFVDMRSGDLIDKLQSGTANVNDIFSKRANLLLGVQVGLHFMFRGVKSYVRTPSAPKTK